MARGRPREEQEDDADRGKHGDGREDMRRQVETSHPKTHRAFGCST
jgi:hypothetical protein